MPRAAQRITKTILLLLVLRPATAATRYVDVNSANPTPPFTNWATAARVIQDAVDAAAAGDVVLVTNGVYATGGRTLEGYDSPSRVAVTKPLTLRSVDGPEVTVIDGWQTGGGYGVYLADGAVLNGLTVTKATWGVVCDSTNAMLTNCIIRANLSGGVVSAVRSATARWQATAALAGPATPCCTNARSPATVRAFMAVGLAPARSTAACSPGIMPVTMVVERTGARSTTASLRTTRRTWAAAESTRAR
jgi:hypothetical protein